MILVNDTQAAVTWRILVPPRSTTHCKYARLKRLSKNNSQTWEQRIPALAGWGTVEVLGLSQTPGSIDTHLQFLCTSLILVNPSQLYSHECILQLRFFFLFFLFCICPVTSHPPTRPLGPCFYMAFHSWSSAFLHLSLHVSVQFNPL